MLEAGLRGRATGAPASFLADVAAVAKKDLAPGDVLDGEGGYCAYGRLVPAGRSTAERLLPIGSSTGATVVAPVAAGETIPLGAVELRHDPVVEGLREETLATAGSRPCHEA